MQSVGTKNTGPELLVRKKLHALGYRFRLHYKHLPGSPDIVFPGRRAVIFVHGCYWHGHNCSKGKLPKSNRSYWSHKIENNRARDASAVKELQALGWRSETVWQCELKDPDAAFERLVTFLNKPFPIDEDEKSR